MTLCEWDQHPTTNELELNCSCSETFDDVNFNCFPAINWLWYPWYPTVQQQDHAGTEAFRKWGGVLDLYCGSGIPYSRHSRQVCYTCFEIFDEFVELRSHLSHNHLKEENFGDPLSTHWNSALRMYLVPEDDLDIPMLRKRWLSDDKHNKSNIANMKRRAKRNKEKDSV